MIASNCKKCCFLKNNKCTANQHIIKNNLSIISPGFCRIFRDQDWYKTNEKNPTIEEAKKQSSLLSDLIIIFNPKQNSLEDLDITINSFPENMLQNIFIINIQQLKGNKYTKKLVNYWKTSKQKEKIFVQNLIDTNENIEDVLKNSFNMVRSKYFFIIPAGQKILNHPDYLKNHSDRFVFWPCSLKINETIIYPESPVYGLYISQAYNKINKHISGKTFTDKVQQLEKMLGIRVLCFLEDNILA